MTETSDTADTRDAADRHDGPTTMATTSDGWWEAERAAFVRARLAALSALGDVVLDIGCGRGTMLAADQLAGRVCVSVDSHLWDEWRSADRLFVVASADALPFRTGCAAVVGSFDMIEHTPDDAPVLAEQRRLVAPTGTVVTAVPADQRLWSGHDDAVGHYRRYSVDTLTAATARHGLEPRRLTYFFAYLWLPAWLTRTRAARPQAGPASPGLAGRIAALGVGALARVERMVLRRWSLPFGTSLWGEFRPGSDA